MTPITQTKQDIGQVLVSIDRELNDPDVSQRRFHELCKFRRQLTVELNALEQTG